MIDLDGAVDCVYFPLEPFAGKPRSPAGHLLDWTVKQNRQQCAAGGGVADAHLTGGDQAIAFLLELLDQVHAVKDGVRRLLPGHRRSLGNVGGSVGNLVDAQSRLGDILRHPDINRDDVRARNPRHHTDAGLAAAKVFGDDGGHILPGLGYALRHHAVVGAERRHTPLV